MKKTLFSILACSLLMAACGGRKGSITQGDRNTLDTLSYALGADVGTGFGYSMADVPLDFDALTEGIEDVSRDRATLTRDSATVLLRQYFMEKRPERARLTAERRSADSTAVAEKLDQTLFESPEERHTISYSIGVDMGTNLVEADIPVQLVWFTDGMKEGFAGEPRIPIDQVRSYLQHYFTITVPERNRKENEEWIAKMEKKSGVIKTESGLLYKIESKGDETIKATDDRDRVKVHYTGWNHKDKAFDSSFYKNKPEQVQKMLKQMNPEGYDKDEPVELALNGVIKGWTEGLKLVGKGGKVTLWIPSELGYGAYGAGNPLIPGHEALRFEVEVVDVIPFVEEPVAPVVETPAAE